jgi:hypothetical protein
MQIGVLARVYAEVCKCLSCRLGARSLDRTVGRLMPQNAGQERRHDNGCTPVSSIRPSELGRHGPTKMGPMTSRGSRPGTGVLKASAIAPDQPASCL